MKNSKTPPPQRSVTQQTVAALQSTTRESIGIPDGYTESSHDLVGTWESSQTPRPHFSPIGVTLCDSGVDETKPSILIHCIAVGQVVVSVKGPEGNRILDRAEPGDAFGIWYSVGMKDVLWHGGKKVFMFQTGEKDVGKPKPMKLFRVFADSEEPCLLPVLGDYRKKSKHAPTPFDLPEPSGAKSPRHRTMQAEDFDPNEKQPF